MAGRNIKGITVEIGGDTTGLQKALQGVEKDIKNTQSQLKDVEKLLKMDPGNTELLSQKQRLLNDAIGETKEKLATLKTAAEQAKQALESGEITQGQYDALQREIVETEEKLKSLEKQAEQSATAMQKIAATGEKLKDTGDKITGVGEKLMPVTLAVTGLGTAAVKTAADFDTAMSQVAAVSGATGDDFDALREKAREMGAKTKFSASEAAEAMNYMAMAGWKTADMLDGIEGIMNLAAASGEDLATTSDIVTDALSAFGLTAADSGHFADVLAAASSNANTNVSMMGETFKYCAPVAGALGYSCEDVAEAIGLMANSGIKSSQAGTALRTMMTKLQGELTLTGEAFGEVTIQTANADGSMRELGDILSDLRGAFSQMTESEAAAAAETLVGKNAMSGFLAVMNAAPADIDKLSTAIANCDGTSQKMADTMQDNLEGQLTILKSQLQELAISFGDILIPVVRDVVSHIQKVVDWLNGLDDGTRKVIITVALLAAALGPVLIVVGKVISSVGTIMTAVPKIVSAFTKIKTLVSGLGTFITGLLPKIGTALTAVKTALTGLFSFMAANPITIVIAAVAALVAAFIYLWNHCEGFRQFWIDLWEGIKTAAVNAWNAITEFFTAAWTAISETAVMVWTAVSQFFMNLWTGITETWTAVWTAVSEFFTAMWSAISLAATTIWTAIKDFFTETWNSICAAVTAAVTSISEFLSGAWTAIQTTATAVWTAISTFFTTIWTAIKTTITNAVTGIKTTVTSTWENIKSPVTGIANTLKSTVALAFNSMWSGIKSTVSGIYNSIRDGFNNAVSYVRGLASQAFNWGADIIRGIINGIRSMISGVVSAVSSVASTIRSYLHFSVPDEGPLTDFESWMPDFMKGLAKGIENSRGLVQKAVEGVSADLTVSPKLAAADITGGTAYTDRPSFDMPGFISAMREAVSSAQGGDITIPVYIGQDRIDEIVVTAGQRANYRSGGR